MPEKPKRLFITVTPELYDRFRTWAERLGLSMSQFGNLCVQSGMSAIIRAVSPEDAFTPEQIVSIIKAAEDKGFTLDLTHLESMEGRSDETSKAKST